MHFEDFDFGRFTNDENKIDTDLESDFDDNEFDDFDSDDENEHHYDEEEDDEDDEDVDIDDSVIIERFISKFTNFK